MAFMDNVVICDLSQRISFRVVRSPMVNLTMTPAIELRNTEYAERYEVKLLLLLSRFHGSITRPTIAATYPPLRMFCGNQSQKINPVLDQGDAHEQETRLLTTKRGRSAVRSQPALIELAEMFVPSCVWRGQLDDNDRRAVSQRRY